MKKLSLLLSLMFLLVGCIESVAVIGGGAANGNIVQSSFQSGLSYGVKKQTGKTPMGHVLAYAKESRPFKKKGSCSSFSSKKNLDICLMLKEKIITGNAKIQEKESTYRLSKEHTSVLQYSINEKSKIKYLD